MTVRDSGAPGAGPSTKGNHQNNSKGVNSSRILLDAAVSAIQNNTSAERNLIGSVLHLRAAGRVAEVLDGLTESDFVDPRLRHVFAVVRELVAVGIGVDPALVVPVLLRSGRLREQLHGDATGLVVDVYCGVPVPASWRRYKALVLAESGRRRAVEAGERISQAACADDPEVALRVAVSEFRALLEVRA